MGDLRLETVVRCVTYHLREDDGIALEELSE